MINRYVAVEEYMDPVSIRSELPEDEGRSEMTESEQGFLCGVVRQFRPKKVVEIGIAAGGTSVVLLNCIQKLGLDADMYSVDLAERCYRDQTKMSGHLLEYAAKNCGLDLSRHKFMLGEVVARRLDEIGDGIDFLVLDTSHSLPGELLEFLVVFPYLKENAVVVLHDMRYQFYGTINSRQGYATSCLFQTVVAKKFINHKTEHPNIAAFQITEDTKKYLMDVFMGLMIPWKYMPDAEQLESYEAILNQCYPKECTNIYYQAKREMQALHDQKIPLAELCGPFDGKRVLLYGTTETARRSFGYFRGRGIEITGFVVSDGRKKKEIFEEKPVYYFSEVPYTKEETLIINATGSKEVEETLRKSAWSWIKIGLMY
mgnify:CR=1 FL=1